MSRSGRFSEFLHLPVVLFGYVDTTDGANRGRAWWFRPLGLFLLAVCLVVAAVAVSVALK